MNKIVKYSMGVLVVIIVLAVGILTILGSGSSSNGTKTRTTSRSSKTSSPGVTAENVRKRYPSSQPNAEQAAEFKNFLTVLDKALADGNTTPLKINGTQEEQATFLSVLSIGLFDKYHTSHHNDKASFLNAMFLIQQFDQAHEELVRGKSSGSWTVEGIMNDSKGRNRLRASWKNGFLRNIDLIITYDKTSTSVQLYSETDIEVYLDGEDKGHVSSLHRIIHWSNTVPSLSLDSGSQYHIGYHGQLPDIFEAFVSKEGRAEFNAYMDRRFALSSDPKQHVRHTIWYDLLNSKPLFIAGLYDYVVYTQWGINGYFNTQPKENAWD